MLSKSLVSIFIYAGVRQNYILEGNLSRFGRMVLQEKKNDFFPSHKPIIIAFRNNIVRNFYDCNVS